MVNSENVTTPAALLRVIWTVDSSGVTVYKELGFVTPELVIYLGHWDSSYCVTLQSKINTVIAEPDRLLSVSQLSSCNFFFNNMISCHNR